MVESNVFYLDLWQAAGSSISVGLIVRDAASGAELAVTPMVEPGGSFETSVGGKITLKIDATETSNALNGKPHVGVTIVVDSDVGNPGVYDFDLVVEGRPAATGPELVQGPV